MHYGALYGVGYGLTGESFAIPTKGSYVSKHPRKPDDKGYHHLAIGETLPEKEIEHFVEGFLAFARNRPDLQFKVTRIGCGLAGLKDAAIAPMFYGAPANCLFDEVWKEYMHDDAEYWGTF